MDYMRRMVLWMIVRVGDVCPCRFRDKAIAAVVKGLVETGTIREEIFRSLDAVL